MKVIILTKPIESAVTFYRSTGVWGILSKTHDVDIIHIAPKNLTPDLAMCADVLFAHRPVSGDELKALVTAYKSGCKIWIDIDDLLWNIPASNPAHSHFSDEHAHNLHTALVNAHLITCTTNYLSNRLEEDFKVKSLVLPNGWNDYIHKIYPYKHSEVKKVLWRGSNTHDGDLYVYRKAFKPYIGLDFVFMGSTPWYFLKQYGGNLDVLHVETWNGNIQSYFDRLIEHCPQAVVVPLEENDFNKCKSNIAQIEATLSGAICIYPDWAENFFSTSSFISFSDSGDLESIFDRLCSTSERKMKEMHEHAQLILHTHYRLSNINRIRFEALKSLVK